MLNGALDPKSGVCCGTRAGLEWLLDEDSIILIARHRFHPSIDTASLEGRSKAH
jgi:hypothetical protein